MLCSNNIVHAHQIEAQDDSHTTGQSRTSSLPQLSLTGSAHALAHHHHTSLYLRPRWDGIVWTMALGKF